MATDDHGQNIAVPDEHTQPFEMYALIRDANNTIARILAEQSAAIPPDPRPALERLASRLEKLEAAPAPAPAAAVPPDPRPDLERLASRLDALESAPAPAPASDLDTLARSIADLKLSLIERTAT